MKPPGAEQDAGSRWGDVHRRFREFVGRHPECRLRSAFSELHEKNPLKAVMPAQSWPFFSSVEALGEVERVTVGIDRLFKSVFARFLGEDPGRLAEFYGLASPASAAIILAEPNGIAGAMSRGDYIETADGLFCLEYNAGSYVGGWQTEVLEDLYLENPLIRRFLEENGLSRVRRRVMRRMFRHIVRDTMASGVWKGGELNLAMIIRPHLAGQVAMHPIALYQREYAEALREEDPELSGDVFCCGYDDLDDKGGGFSYQGRPIHALFEQHAEMPEARAFRFLKAGRLNLFSGLITGLLSDKRNVALLSENVGGTDLTPEERDLVERHIPWTRRAVDGEVLCEGRRSDLRDLTLKNREKFVVKKGLSLAGREVHVGPALSQAEWEARVREAFADGSWIVQSYCDGVPYVFQAEEEGAVAHDTVFGFFVFGDSLGGTFLRVQPCGRGGIVNTHRGAEVGVVLEVAGEAAPAS